MTKAQAAPKISYDHGVSDKKLIGETIGVFFDRTVEAHRDREALVVRHQNVRWSWCELGLRVDDLAAGPRRQGFEGLAIRLQAGEFIGGGLGGVAIVIAHRPSVLAVVDVVAVIQDGKLTAFGPKEAILGKVARDGAPRPERTQAVNASNRERSVPERVPA